MKPLQSVLKGAFAALALLVPANAMAGPVVVELFTSQGCSSCPPADAILGQLADRDDVLALSLPVDYWDYLGWKDSFGSPQFSARQQLYARARGDRSVYTPQIVVNGRRHVVGSDAQQLSAMLNSAGGQVIDVGLAVNEDQVSVDIPADPGGARRRATVWLAGFSKAESVDIGRGENAGRRIVYHNVVRKLIKIGEWTGKPQSLRVARDKVWPADVTGCAVIIQENLTGGAGPVLGAALVRE